MTAGTLSYAKARALTRVATSESETQLLELAAAGSAENLERVVRAWKAMDDARELTVERARHQRRAFSIVVDDDGSYVVKGRLDPEVGAVLMRAVEAASDVLFRAAGPDPSEDQKGSEQLDGSEHQTGSEDQTGSDELAGSEDRRGGCDTTPAQRRADAVGLLAERALAAGFSDGARSSRADRYQVLLHVEPETLQSDRRSGRAELDGVRISKATARRLTCDAGVSVVSEGSTHVPAGTSPCCAVASAGRRRRTIPPAVRRALLARDKGCRFPGCGSRFCEAHHIVHWADGGPNDLSNLVLLCRRHHRFVHEEGITICMDRTRAVVFFTAGGRAIAGSPAPHPGPGCPQPTAPRLGRPRPAAPRPLPPAPESPSAYPGAARFVRDRDIPWDVEARAWEALDTPSST